MSTTASSLVCTARREIVLARLADYLELSKPRIMTLVLVVVVVSAWLGSWGSPAPWTLLCTLVGTALVAASASALNQLIERRRDALMERTADRPLPAGRIGSPETIWLAVTALTLGVFMLAWLVNLATAMLGLLTWVIYVAAYTPLKARTAANTAVGAVAGALPVLIGWAAVDGSFAITGGPLAGGIRVAALFLIVYLWQFPHFMAIAWLYRRQYSAAGMHMLTVVDSTGRRAGAQAVLAALALVPVSLLPALHAAAPAYWIGAITLGVSYLAVSAAFCWRRDEVSARGLLHASLVYLPSLLVLLVITPLM